MMAEFKSFFKQVEGNEGQKCHYPTRLDTYGCGCAHDCKYCYAKSLLGFRNLWHPTAPSIANIKKIENKVKTLPKGTVLRLGGMTDCFQPCEKKYKVTYETIKLLNKYGIHYLIVTKSDMVADDAYVKILDKKLAHIQITVTSTDDAKALTYEKATPSSARIKAIEKLSALGYDVAIRISPFIPEYIDFDVLNNVKCDKAIVEFLRINAFIKKTFDLDFTKYTHKESGYYHLPIEEKKALIKEIIGFPQLSVCEDCTDAYNYWKAYVNYNPADCCNLSLDCSATVPIGNRALMALKKVAFLSSQKAQEGTAEKAMEWIDKNIGDDSCLISGFQSPTEKKVLDHALNKGKNIILVLPTTMCEKCPKKLESAVTKGKALIVAPFQNTSFSLRAAAEKRNEYVLNIADEIVIGDITKGGMLDRLLNNKEAIRCGNGI